jgi:hypothetical protein
VKYGSVCSGIEVGQRFGRLTVLEIYVPRRRDQARVRCICDCGNAVDTTGNNLRTKRKGSCGCWRRDRAGQLHRKHGLSKTPAYTMFYDARKRAHQFGVPFSIEPTDIVVPTICPVLGVVLDSSSRDTTPSLDRMRPALGYIPSNVRVISFRANRIKSDASVAELRAILAYAEASDAIR